MTGERNLLKLVDALPDSPGVGVDATPYRLHEQVGFLLRKSNQRHLAIFAAAIGDLTPPQFAVLAKLSDVGETAQTQLGAMVAMDAATVKGVVDRLVTRGYVARGSHESDRRQSIVGLTSEGRAAVEQLIPLARGITAETLAPLSQQESAMLLGLLAKIG